MFNGKRNPKCSLLNLTIILLIQKLDLLLQILEKVKIVPVNQVWYQDHITQEEIMPLPDKLFSAIRNFEISNF